jgi:ketosteroid isomerase-like protein
MAVASKVAGPPAPFKVIQRGRTSRYALMAAAAAASWVWQTAPALAQGAPKVRIITGNGDFLIDMRPATATTIGPAAEPLPTASSEQTSAASPSGAVPTTLTPAPAPSLFPLLAQQPVTAPAPTTEVAISETQPAPDTPAMSAPAAVADMGATATKPPAPNAAESAAQSAGESTAEAVQAAVRAWANAWAGKDLNAYFASYGQGFAPAGHQARKSWETSRRARIASKSQISVTLSDLAVAVQGGVKGDVATARFKQHYSAGALNISSRKLLELTREANERWVIVRETAGR